MMVRGLCGARSLSLMLSPPRRPPPLCRNRRALHVCPFPRTWASLGGQLLLAPPGTQGCPVAGRQGGEGNTGASARPLPVPPLLPRPLRCVRQRRAVFFSLCGRRSPSMHTHTTPTDPSRAWALHSPRSADRTDIRLTLHRAGTGPEPAPPPHRRACAERAGGAAQSRRARPSSSPAWSPPPPQSLASPLDLRGHVPPAGASPKEAIAGQVRGGGARATHTRTQKNSVPSLSLKNKTQKQNTQEGGQVCKKKSSTP